MTSVKTAECIERQTLVQCDTTGDKAISLVVNAVSRTPLIPYGDAFESCTKFCITSNASQNQSMPSCKILITIGVVFSKSVMVKSIIKSAALKGLTDYHQDLVALLRKKVQALTGSSVSNQSVAGALSAADGTTEPNEGTNDHLASHASSSALQSGSSGLHSFSSFTLILLLISSFLFGLYYPFAWPTSRGFIGHEQHTFNLDNVEEWIKEAHLGMPFARQSLLQDLQGMKRFVVLNDDCFDFIVLNIIWIIRNAN
jgi:hypothetical protein